MANDANTTTSVPTVPITLERKPFLPEKDDKGLQELGVARANIAATHDKPEGTSSWSTRYSRQTVLQQHCAFFDKDEDSVIYPWDTYIGFRALGFMIPLSLLAVFIIHANFSYPTLPSWIPDPQLPVYVDRIHKDKHGSDTGTYDTEGRFIPQKFEDIFAKYADGRDYLTIRDVANLLNGQRIIADPIGWGGAMFEWLATYIMLWPEDGKMRKEDIRRIYDGSIFSAIAERRTREKKRG
ncbi:Caleosin related protein-domain-containing protein [Microdochium trichocladiopsis]|uniref:Caleosin related protein-domain-containing protein n=1 Tax=Microdochium trichocladiopsis TaxID=1682393 RepID=A0A9P8Y7S4_9PEZI|nr:Caleosin related protein-domain-containing protein [Microdochium trichocladiopsis]KAH7029647.1 Caleosin related protein-domain-containing protein [Microdochium trichocladiopsis]